jgi:hypothetical protein
VSIVYRAVCNGIVGGGRFVLIVYRAVLNGIVGGGRFLLILTLHTLRWLFRFMHNSLNVPAYNHLGKSLTFGTAVYSVTYRLYIACV